ncbi:MAG: hypothetical protein D6740_07860 [Alphaproteobacteria bacterium]|nr:MAG: hypothetical protein D6740_07860 [Alphaproteobacteria bacterium]
MKLILDTKRERVLRLAFTINDHDKAVGYDGFVFDNADDLLVNAADAIVRVIDRRTVKAFPKSMRPDIEFVTVVVKTEDAHKFVQLDLDKHRLDAPEGYAYDYDFGWIGYRKGTALRDVLIEAGILEPEIDPDEYDYDDDDDYDPYDYAFDGI